MLVGNLFFFFLACVVLVVAGTFLVKALLRLKPCFRLGEFVIGFVIMAVATSLPELFVGISSALAHTSELSFGNVIGANITDLTIVVGAIVLFGKGIKMKSQVIETDSLYMFFICILPPVLMLIGNSLSRFDGAILLLAFVLYVANLLKERKLVPCKIKEEKRAKIILIYGTLFLLCLGLMFLSSRFVVSYATLLSIDLMVPTVFMGLIIVSLGTTLPELIFESRAVLMGHSPMALGDLIGSVVVNSTLVLGLVALIHPIVVDNIHFLTSGIFMVIVALLFFQFIKTKDRLSVWEGIVFLSLYFVFLATQLLGIV